jgi:hypothetical protein
LPGPGDQGAYTSNSDTCPAGHPVFAVTFTRTYRVVAETGIVTVLALAGSNA